MDSYEKLRGLLCLARQIDRKLSPWQDVVQVARHPPADPGRRFPTVFARMLISDEPIPTVEELRIKRQHPHQEFDIVELKTWCELRIRDEFSSTEFVPVFDLDLRPASEFE
jgi:hypothetical protein